MLSRPYNKGIEKGPHFATIKEIKDGVVVDGDFAKLSEVVKVGQGVLEALGPKGIILIEKLIGKKILHPKVQLPYDIIGKLKDSNSLIEHVKDLRKYLGGLRPIISGEKLEHAGSRFYYKAGTGAL